MTQILHEPDQFLSYFPFWSDWSVVWPFLSFFRVSITKNISTIMHFESLHRISPTSLVKSCKLSFFYLFIDHNFNSHVTNELTLTLRADSLNQRVRYLRNGICLAQFDMSRWVLIRINLLSQIKILISGFFNFRFQRKRPTCEMDLKGESLEDLFGCNLVTGLINAVKGSLVL